MLSTIVLETSENLLNFSLSREFSWYYVKQRKKQSARISQTPVAACLPSPFFSCWLFFSLFQKEKFRWNNNKNLAINQPESKRGRKNTFSGAINFRTGLPDSGKLQQICALKNFPSCDMLFICIIFRWCVWQTLLCNNECRTVRLVFVSPVFPIFSIYRTNAAPIWMRAFIFFLFIIHFSLSSRFAGDYFIYSISFFWEGSLWIHLWSKSFIHFPWISHSASVDIIKAYKINFYVNIVQLNCSMLYDTIIFSLSFSIRTSITLRLTDIQIWPNVRFTNTFDYTQYARDIASSTGLVDRHQIHALSYRFDRLLFQHSKF